jgi:pyruvate,water dikinase
MDIEWAKDGQDNQLYVVQARPETVQSQRDMNVMKTYRLKPYDESTKIQMKKIVSGMAIGSGIGQGKAHFIASSTKLSEFKDGEVLVTGMTDPDWEPIMRKAVAIVTNEGGRTCHAAIIARGLLQCFFFLESLERKDSSLTFVANETSVSRVGHTGNCWYKERDRTN